jgi:glycosyltransferase involved in cell wall biosynthesis
VGLAALWVASRLRLPLIGSFHTHLEEYTRLLSGSPLIARGMREYQRWLYGCCRQILAPSEATRTMLASRRLDRSRIALWTRGVSTTRFSPARRSSRLRQEWNVSETRPAVVFVGRLSREKGLSGIAEIRQMLLAQGIDHRFVFVGDGPMAAELRSQHRDAVFTGTLAPEDVAVAMASSDLFVFPSRTDTAGNVVLEAQASGLPVLVTDEGGPQENIRAGLSGLVCDSVAEMARQTAALCADPERRARMGTEARSYALGRTWECALDPLYRGYRAAAASVAASPDENPLDAAVSPASVEEHSSRAPAA